VSCASGGGGLGGAAEVEDGDHCSGGTIRRGGEGEGWIGSSGMGCERESPEQHVSRSSEIWAIWAARKQALEVGLLV
jgi:hypothetical protein